MSFFVHSRENMLYRKDIDGLRAVSVLLVVFYHSKISFFSGGFIGVDIFFVISGYLITGILSEELNKKKINLRKFYTHRLKRLMPAYLLVTLVTSIFSFFLFLPSELENYSQSLLYSFAFLSNIYFANETGGYFIIESDLFPLLHSWSLSVEEQYYLIWPLVMIILYRLFNGRYMGGLAFIGFMFLLFVSESMAQQNPQKAYFLIQSRGFELLSGGMLFFFINYIPKVNRFRNDVLSVLGGLVIIAGSITLNKSDSFPGLYALIPCLGAMLLIYTGNNQTGVMNRILSVKYLVLIGLISYPLYLWHWPILSFMSYLKVEFSSINIFLVISLSIILSFLTWKYIEIPFRSKSNLSFSKTFLFLFLTPLSVTFILFYLVDYTQGLPSRFPPSLLNMTKIIGSNPHEIRGACNNGEILNFAPPNDCVLGVKKEKIDVLLVGDSHANSFSGMLDQFLLDASYRGYDITRDGTPYLAGADLVRERAKPKKDQSFIKQNAAVSNEISSGNYRFVVMAGRWSTYVLARDEKKVVNYYLINDTHKALNKENSLKVFKGSLIKSIQNIIDANSIPVIVKEVPTFNRDISKCEFNNRRLYRDDDCTVSLSEVYSSHKPINAIFSQLKKMYPQIIFIDPKDIMCDAEKCFSFINDIPLYRDPTHLNDIGSKYLGLLYISAMGNPLLIGNL